MPIQRYIGCTAWDPTVHNEYNYKPSLAAGAVFCVLFGLTLTAHVYQAYRKRTWWTLVFAAGALMELLGWAARTWSSQCPYNLNAFLMQICTLIMAPTFFTAGIYIVLGRLIALMGRHTSPISASTYLWIFCTCDVLSLVVQAIGGAMASQAVSKTPPTDSKTGTHIMVAGIDFQMASITVFVGFFIEFLRRVAVDRKTLSRRVKVLIAATALSCALIYIRSIYRTVELLQGWRGYLISHEAYFVGLDGATMLLAVAVYNFVHPGWFLQTTEKVVDTEIPPETVEAGWR